MRVLALVVVLGLPGAARAGACCVASTTTIPTRLGECETWMAGIGLQGDVTVGRWDHGGSVAGSSLAEQALITTLAAGYRWDRKGQIGLTAPLWLQHKATTEESAWGGGPGDLRVAVTWDPIEERFVPPGKVGAPVPVFTLGVRIPTGRSWREAKGDLGEDVTGLAGPAVTVGISAERVTGRTPWTLGVDSDLGLDAGRFVPVLRASAGVGHYFGMRWSLMGGLRHVEAWGSDGARSARTTAGLRVIHGQRLKWRAWAGVETDLPIPWLGVDSQMQVSAGAGFSLVR